MKLLVILFLLKLYATSTYSDTRVLNNSFKMFNKSMKLINFLKLVKITKVNAGDLTIYNILQNIDPINDVRKLQIEDNDDY